MAIARDAKQVKQVIQGNNTSATSSARRPSTTKARQVEKSAQAQQGREKPQFNSQPYYNKLRDTISRNKGILTSATDYLNAKYDKNTNDAYLRQLDRMISTAGKHIGIKDYDSQLDQYTKYLKDVRGALSERQSQVSEIGLNEYNKIFDVRNAQSNMGSYEKYVQDLQRQVGAQKEAEQQSNRNRLANALANSATQGWGIAPTQLPTDNKADQKLLNEYDYAQDVLNIAKAQNLEAKYKSYNYEQLKREGEKYDPNSLEGMWFAEKAKEKKTLKDYDKEIEAKQKEIDQLNATNTWGVIGQDYNSQTGETYDIGGNINATAIRIAEDEKQSLEAERLALEKVSGIEAVKSEKDFAEKAKAGDTKYSLKDSNIDRVYKYINGEDFGETRQHNDSIGGFSLMQLNQLTDDERQVFSYYYNLGEKDVAKEYLAFKKYDLDQREANAVLQRAVEFADEHGGLASAESVPLSLVSGVGLIDIAGQNIARDLGLKKGDQRINYNTNAVKAGKMNTAIRGTVAQNLADQYGTINIDPKEHPMWAEFLNGKSLGDVYQLGMSTVDSMVAGLIGNVTGIGATASVLLGGSAGTQGVLDALERGATDDQALTMGLINGAFETIFEYVSLDKLIHPSGNFVRDMLAQMFTEGSEEFNTSLANQFADYFVMGEKSEFVQKVKQLMDEKGLEEHVAMKEAWHELGKDMIWDFIGGAVMGGVSSGAWNSIGNIYNEIYGNQTFKGDLGSVISQGQAVKATRDQQNYSYDAFDVTEQLDELQRKSDAGEKITNKEVNDILEKIQSAQDREVRKAITSSGDLTDSEADQVERAVQQKKASEKIQEDERLKKAYQSGMRAYGDMLSLYAEAQTYKAENARIEAEKAEGKEVGEIYTREKQDTLLKSRAEYFKQTKNISRSLPIAISNDALVNVSGIKTENGKTVVTFSDGTQSDIQDTRWYNERTGEEISRFAKTFGSDALDVYSVYKNSQYSIEAFSNLAERIISVAKNSNLSFEQGIQSINSQISGELTELQKRNLWEIGRKTEISKAPVKKNKALKGVKIYTGDVVVDGKTHKGATDLDKNIRDLAEGITAFSQDLSFAFYHGGESAVYGAYRDGVVYINVDAKGKDGKSLVTYTMSHELTHYIQQYNNEDYNALKAFVIDKLAQKTGKSLEEMIRDKQGRESRHISADDALDEVVADGCEMMLLNSDILSDLAQKNRSLFDRIIDHVKEWFNRLRDELNPRHEEAKELMKYADELQKMWDEALKKALANEGEVAEAENTGIVQIAGVAFGADKNTPSESAVIEVQENEVASELVAKAEQGQLSHATEEEKLAKKSFSASSGEGSELKDENGNNIEISVRELRNQRFRQNPRYTEKDIRKFNRLLDKVADYLGEASLKYTFVGLKDIKDATIRLDRNGRIVMSAMVKNNEYPVNFDFTKLCKKRQALQRVIDQLAREKGKQNEDGTITEIDLSPKNIAKINKALAEAGVETTCLGCFVEASRGQMQSLYQNKVIDNWNKWLEEKYPDSTEYFDFANNTEIEFSEEEKASLQAFMESVGQISNDEDESKSEKFAKSLMDASPSVRKRLKYSDLTTETGRTALHQNFPELERFISTKLGASSFKAVEAFVPYNGEIELLNTGSKFKVENGSIVFTESKRDRASLQKALSKIGGARSQSFSDFIITHLFDVLQKTGAFASRDLKAHTYTKEISRAILFGLTGEKHNLSVLLEVDPKVDAWSAGLTKEGDFFVGDYKHFKLKEGEKGKAHYIQSIGWDDAVKLQNTEGYSKDNGIILVPLSYRSYMKALKDPEVRMIIGYHSSGMPLDIKEETHYNMATDYQGVQNTLKVTGFAKPRYEIPSDIPSYATPPSNIKPIKGKSKTSKSDIQFTDPSGKPVTIQERFEQLSKGMPKGSRERTQVAKDVLREFLMFLDKNQITVTTAKAEEGHGKFDLYGDTEKTNDPYLSTDHYIEYCIERGYLPQFYEFTFDKKGEFMDGYYAQIYDFNVFDRKTYNRKTGRHEDTKTRKAYAPQNPVRITDDKGNLNFPKGFSATDLSLVDKFMADYNYQMEQQFKVVPEVVQAVKSGQLSHADEDYQSALDSGDYKTAQDIIDSVAHANGYTTKVYHGSINFGDHTVLRTENIESGTQGEMYAFSPYFATDKLEIAETYSRKPNARQIGKRTEESKSEKKLESMQESFLGVVDDLLNEVKKEYPSYNGNRWRGLFRTYLSDYLFIGDLEAREFEAIISDIWNDIIRDVKSRQGLDAKEVEALKDALTRGRYVRRLTDYVYDKEIRGIIESRDKFGNYEYWANTEGMLEIDAKGNKWMRIPLGEYIEDFNKWWREQGKAESLNGLWTTASTRTISDYAKDRGKTGVIFKNILDDGGRSNNDAPVGTVYAFFDPQAQVKSADLITYDDDGEVIPPSERFNRENNDIRFSVGDVEQEAVNHFGTTDNWETAGYMLPDGRMLDFSGAHWLEGADEKYIEKWKAKNNIRQVDHEDIFEAYESLGKDFPSDSAMEFIKRGNIRLKPEGAGIELYGNTEPTEAQYKQLRKFIKEAVNKYHTFSIDYTKSRRNHQSSPLYEGNISADRIINDIRHYYETGEVREQGLSRFYGDGARFSLEDVEPVNPTSDGWKRTLTVSEVAERFPDFWNVTAEESETRNPTQIKSTVSTYRKIYNILKSEGFDGTILDASSGLGYGTRAGREEFGYDVEDIEPYPDKDYNPKYRDYSKLKKKYDVIISNAVLNVIPQDQRDALVVKMGQLLKDGGRMFINVRGDDVNNLASNPNNVEIAPMEWYVSTTGSYQKGFTGNELKAYLEDALGDGFTVEKTNKFGKASVIVTKVSEGRGNIQFSRADRAIVVNDTYQDFTGQILNGEKTIETRWNAELSKYEGQRLAIIRKVGNKREVVGYFTVGKPILYTSQEQFDADYDRHRVGSDSNYYIGKNGRNYKWGYPLEDVERTEPHPVGRTSGTFQVREGQFSRADLDLTEDELNEALVNEDYETAERIARNDASISKKALRDDLLNRFYIPDYMRKEIGREIDKFADDIARKGTVNENTRQELYDKLFDAGRMKIPADEASIQIANAIKGMRLYVPKGVQSDFAGEYNRVRAKLMGHGVYLTANSYDQGVDKLNAELSEQYPWIFKADNNDEKLILEDILDIIENKSKDRELTFDEYAEEMQRTEGVDREYLIDSMERETDYAIRAYQEKAELEYFLKNKLAGKLTAEDEKKLRQRAIEAERRGRELEKALEKSEETYSRERARAEEQIEFYKFQLKQRPVGEDGKPVDRRAKLKDVKKFANDLLSAPIWQNIQAKDAYRGIQEVANLYLRDAPITDIFDKAYDVAVELIATSDTYSEDGMGEKFRLALAREITEGVANADIRDEYSAMERMQQKLQKQKLTNKELKEHYRELQKKQADRRKATKYRQQILKLQDKAVKMIQKPTPNQYIPTDLMREISEMCKLVSQAEIRFYTRKVDRLEEAYKEATEEDQERIKLRERQLNRTIAKLVDISIAYQRIQKNELYAHEYDPEVNDMINSLKQTLNGETLSDLESEKLKEIYDVMSALMKSVSESNKARLQGKQENILTLAKEWSDEMSDAMVIKDDALRRYLQKQADPDVMFNYLGGFKGKDSVPSRLQLMFVDSMRRYIDVKREFYDTFQDLIETKEWKKMMYQPTKELVDWGLKDSDGNAVATSRAMMLSAYKLLKQDDSFESLAKAGFQIPKMKEFYKDDMQGAFGGAEESKFYSQSHRKEMMDIAQRLRDLDEEEKNLDKTDPNFQAQSLSIEAQRKAELRQWGKYYEEECTKLTELMKNIEKEMTPFEKEFIKRTEKWYEHTNDLRNEVNLSMYGFVKEGVKNYTPIHRDLDQVNIDMRTDNFEAPRNLENLGLNKERVKSPAPIQLTDINFDLTQSLEGIARFYGFTEAQRTFNKIWNAKITGTNNTIKGKVGDIFGKGNNALTVSAQQYVNNYIKAIAGSNYSREAVLGKLYGHVARASLTLNLRVAISQLASIPTASAYLGWGAVIKGMGKGLEYAFSTKLKEELAKKSEYFWFRYKGDGGMPEYVEASKGAGVVDRLYARVQNTKVGHALLDWCKIMDCMATSMMYPMAEAYVDDHFSLSGEEREAKIKEVYEETLRKTQPNYTETERSDLLRDKREGMRLFTMFKTQSNKNLNILMEANGELRRVARDFKQGKATATQLKEARVKMANGLTSVILGGGLAFATFRMIANFLLGTLSGYRDDDDELTFQSIMKGLGKEWLSSLFGNFMGGSEIYDIVYSKVSGEKYYGISDNAMGAISDLLEAGADLKVKPDEEGSFDEVIKSWDNFVFQLCDVAGIPLGNARKIVSAGNMWANDIRNGTFGQFEGNIDRSAKQDYNRMLKAILNNDTEKASEIYAMLYNAEAEKQYDEWHTQDQMDKNVLNQVKRWYTSGEVDEATARQILDEYTELKEDEIYDALAEYAGIIETGYSWSEIKEAYNAEEITDDELKAYMRKYRLMDEDDIEDAMANQKGIRDTGYSYSEIKEAYLEGAVNEKQVRDYMAKYRGMKPENIETSMRDLKSEKETGVQYSEAKYAYYDGELSKSEVTYMLTHYGNMSSEEAKEKADIWEFRKNNPKWREDATDTAIKEFFTVKGKISADKFMPFYQAHQDLPSDKDANGKTISGSKKKKVLLWLLQNGYTLEEAVLLHNLKWSKSKVYEVYDLYGK